MMMSHSNLVLVGKTAFKQIQECNYDQYHPDHAEYKAEKTSKEKEYS